MRLHVPMEEEQSRLVIRLGLRDVGLAPTPPLRAVPGPVAGPATVVAGVVSCRLGPVSGAALSISAGATLGAPSCPGLGTSAPLSRLAALAATSRGRGLPPPPVTAPSLPLLLSEVELPTDGDASRERLWLVAVGDLEATYRLLDRHGGEVQQRLDRASGLPVPLGDAAEELLDGSLLVVGVVAELHHLLQQSVETEGEVINILTWLEGQVLPLLAKCLESGLAGAVAADTCRGAVAADTCRSDGVPGVNCILESVNCISGGVAAMRASS